MSETIRYSPHPIDFYPWARASAFLRDDPEAWNLAWLSFAPEHGSKFDAGFSTAVRRTCQSVVATGSVDLIEKWPPKVKVMGLMHLPPPAAHKRIFESPMLFHLPLFELYGDEWLKVFSLRAREYREPHHPSLDAPIVSIEQAKALTNNF